MMLNYKEIKLIPLADLLNIPPAIFAVEDCVKIMFVWLNAMYCTILGGGHFAFGSISTISMPAVLSDW